MIINETTLGELCARVADGDEKARREFDRHVLPVVEAIVGRWLSRPRSAAAGQGGTVPAPGNSMTDSATEGWEANLLPKITAAVCTQMVAEAASRRRTRRRPAPSRPKPLAGETLSTLIEMHTVSRLIPWPA